MINLTCNFLTADILVATGSSLPVFIAAFAPPWKPIVFEEERKEIVLYGPGSSFPRHFYDDRMAVLLKDGMLLSQQRQDVLYLLESMIDKKLARRRLMQRRS